MGGGREKPRDFTLLSGKGCPTSCVGQNQSPCWLLPQIPCLLNAAPIGAVTPSPYFGVANADSGGGFSGRSAASSDSLTTMYSTFHSGLARLDLLLAQVSGIASPGKYLPL